MNLFPYLRTAGAILGFLVISQPIFTQCAAPGALWLNPPHTSTEFILDWAHVPGAEQYDIRYWASLDPNDKTIVTNCGPAPFSLKGLKKNTAYTIEIRSKCGGQSSSWGGMLQHTTMNSSGICNLPVNAGLAINGSEIQITWASSGKHTIRYRPAGLGDWLIPAGGLTITN
ncbi:MAG: fibronectin type III domain-containing protein, partial [Saprospiraceae bacterium]|nr:fibronectin type III domain-containing protein [Saprospiraceae bacterium]